ALLRAPNAGPEALARRAAGVAARIAPGLPEEEVARAAERATGVRRPALRVDLAPHLAVRLLAHAADRAEASGGGVSFARGRATLETTLDAALQRAAVDSLARNLAALEARGARDGAVLAVDNASGDVLAYVGSSGRLSLAPQVDGVRARRQAGSTLKPFL